jgi:DNA-binding winged helix-turn-helix (wHTH) protein/Flp pilus assembly protein TadD
MPGCGPWRLQDSLFFAYRALDFYFAEPLKQASELTVPSDGSIDLLYVFDDYLLDPDRCELRRGSSPVAIEPQAFDLLQYLIRHRERVVSRDELIESIWAGRLVSESALSTRINAVRNAIGDSGTQQRLIKTLPRRGIRFVGDVREEPQAVEELPSGASEGRAVETTELYEANNQSNWQAPEGSLEKLPQLMASPLKPSRRFFSRLTLLVFAAVSLACFGVLTWSYLARSAQSERTRANIQTAAKLTHISEQINMISREDYESVRALQHWAVDLDPHNATALARLTSAIVTGVLNHWSDDVVADLHTADLALQDAIRIAPDSMVVHSAQCHILRAMRQFEAAIKLCSEIAQRFPDHPFPHKEIGYNKLMLGRLDEALAEFREADRLAPDSRMRWTWNQGMGLVYLMRGQDQDALERLSRAALEAPNAGHTAAYLASAYALVGREQEARDALDHYMKVWPNTSLNNFGPMVGTAAFNSQMKRVLEGLHLAGLPD